MPSPEKMNENAKSRSSVRKQQAQQTPFVPSMIKEESLSTIGGNGPMSANDSVIGQQSSALLQRPSNNIEVTDDVIDKNKKPPSPTLTKKASKIKK